MHKLLLQKGITFGAGVVLAVFAAGFLCWSAYLGLATRLEPWLAALITGLAVALLALLLFQAGGALGSSPGPKPEALKLKPEEVASKLEHELDSLVGPQVARVISRNAKTATFAAIGLGLAAGRSREMRQSLRGVIHDLMSPPPEN